jgi:hypothetical protein
MKASLTFDLDLPEDRDAHLRCTKALDLTLCLNEFKIQLLAQLKYDELTEEQHAAYFEVKKLLDQTLEEYGINLDELNR